MKSLFKLLPILAIILMTCPNLQGQIQDPQAAGQRHGVQGFEGHDAAGVRDEESVAAHPGQHGDGTVAGGYPQISLQVVEVAPHRAHLHGEGVEW